MRKRIACALLAALVAAVGATGAYASGFNIYEAGSRATALGGAFTATADDGSAMFYNLAGLSFQKGQSAEVNVIVVAPEFEFAAATTDANTSPATGTAVKQQFPVPGAYYTNAKSDKTAFGIGVYAPFGLGLEWENAETWVGRQASYDVAIETIYVTPAVSFMLADGFSLGVGLDIATQHIDLNRMTLDPTTGQNALNTRIEGRSAVNVTPSLGMMYRPDQKWSLGLMYHHKKTMKYTDRTATLKNIGTPGTPANAFAGNVLTGLGAPGGATTSEQLLSSELNLPWILSLGAGYHFSSKFRAEVNYVRFGWSEFKALELDFQNNALDQALHFNYEDSWQMRAGIEFAASPKWDLMAGFVYDNSPQPLASVSPILPDSDRKDYSLGARFKTGHWDFNASYMFVKGDERTNIENGQAVRNSETYPIGSYKTVANLFGLAVGYHF